MSAALSFTANVASVSGLQAQAAAPRAARTGLVVENRVHLRFMRGGRKHRPFYRVVAIDSKKPRESRPLEFLGHYDPLSKETQLKAPEIKQWLNNGAQPTETVERLLKRAMIIVE